MFFKELLSMGNIVCCGWASGWGMEAELIQILP